MEWRTKHKAPPKAGDTRVRVKFAWWPVVCKDGFTRWLCRVRIFEEFKDIRVSHFPYPPWPTYRGEWVILTYCGVEWRTFY